MTALVIEMRERLPELASLTFRAEIEPMTVDHVRRDFYDPFGASDDVATEASAAAEVEPAAPIESLEAVYLRLLEMVKLYGSEIGDRPIAGHWPFVGSRYRGLAVVGQALQGWDATNTPARFVARDVRSQAGRERTLRGIREWARSRPEPMLEVVSRGHRAGSPFWTVSRHFVDALEPGDGEWFSRYAWWNIYPLGWDEPDSAPTGALKQAQIPFVHDLFWAAMDEISADRVLLVAGQGMWWGMQQALGLETLTAGRKPVIASGAVRGRKLVAAYHPRGARQLGITDKEQVAAMVEAFAGI